MIELLIAIILLQPPAEPPPIITPVIKPCENMLPYAGASLPSEWILPDGTDCTPGELSIVEDAPPAPIIAGEFSPIGDTLPIALVRPNDVKRGRQGVISRGRW